MKPLNLQTLSIDDTIKNFISSYTDVVIDDYSFRGGNGALFFGKHRILDKRIALKFYFIDKSDTSHAEPQTLAKLKHQNILPVHDAGLVSKEYAYFLSPHIEGGDLHDYLLHKKLNLFNVIKIVKGILSGLTYLHSPQVRLIHRDLKPGNVLIDKDCNPFIADFGSIVRLPENGRYKRGWSRHTFVYTPPETISSEHYFACSDIYQTGILLYQLLGGYFPDQDLAWLNKRQKNEYIRIGDPVQKTQYFNAIVGDRICKGKLLDYNTLPVFLPLRLKRIIKKATDVDFKKRYQFASEFTRDIHSFMNEAVNWIVCENFILVTKYKKFVLRVVNRRDGWQVEKKSKSQWRKYNKFKGTLSEIADEIHNNYDRF